MKPRTIAEHLRFNGTKLVEGSTLPLVINWSSPDGLKTKQTRHKSGAASLPTSGHYGQPKMVKDASGQRYGLYPAIIPQSPAALRALSEAIGSQIEDTNDGAVFSSLIAAEAKLTSLGRRKAYITWLISAEPFSVRTAPQRMSKETIEWTEALIREIRKNPEKYRKLVG